GLADPDLILVSAMCTFSPRSSARPVCSASVITGTSPAHDTRLSSSNTAESAMKLCDTCTGSAFLKPVRLLCGNSNHPSSEGTFLISTHAHPVNRSVDRGLVLRQAWQRATAASRARMMWRHPMPLAAGASE